MAVRRDLTWLPLMPSLSGSDVVLPSLPLPSSSHVLSFLTYSPLLPPPALPSLAYPDKNYAPRLSMQPGYKYQSGALDVTQELQVRQGFQNRLYIVWMADSPSKASEAE